MKTKSIKIFGCFLLVCATGFGVGICASAVNIQAPLSENELELVYGGDCGPCIPDGKGCDGGSSTTCGERDPCTGDYRQSCRQDEKKCQNLSGPCDPKTKTCSEKQYSVYHCIEIAGECVTQDWYGPKNCAGDKDWCAPE